ncbi:DEAD BOX ATP-DEPENDENT RNA HELICASE, putative [Babesia bigemina]|uniref:DEAD BOX ATP-DEPENDENT RNA HELICASE, putative n=1 Tax=Babesia bigemina TaxID=5866 RepID=A0A061DE05_BABBI|nr:DEAD BOX ATP-DEPENDENT RNA HELICASE, putative [Babesia bigemina]CDR96740.1 DEAD BOX ATP-DEPENDENT RNA HELICASE, putative [Babesia bigemina]|eukprot:XP_012768926.1 DEAD BOX ATP-DEPENDENT RNA HELICASE, putative [Babesia bigemina]
MVRRLARSVYGRLTSTSFGSRPLLEGFRKGRPPAVRLRASGDAAGSSSAVETAVSADTCAPDSRVKLHPLLRLALLRSKGISQLNEVQESAFLSILSGKDVTVHAPVGEFRFSLSLKALLGAGKTLAYLLPVVNNIYNIHDLLEDLQLRSGSGPQRDKEDAVRLNALGYSRRVPHALLPRSMSDLRQDPSELDAAAAAALQSATTAQKLVDTLCKVDPRLLARGGSGLPVISRRLWGRRCRNSVFRALLTNPLGAVRCCMVVVPNKDLVSQVVSELAAIDPLGRLSVQTLTHVHRAPPRAPVVTDGVSQAAPGEQPFYPSPHTLHYLGGMDGKLRLSLEDERAMVQSVPTVPVSEGTMETVPVNMGRGKRSVVKVPMRTAPGNDLALSQLSPAIYSVDGLVPRSVEFLFLNDLLSSRRLGVVPACVVFDEVDALFENNASRSAMMEICSILRPRPRLYNPLVHHRRRRAQQPPPCQFVHVASTLNYGGLQTAGSMLYERFTSSRVISTCLNHHLASCEMRFVDVDAEFESKLRCLMEVIVANPLAKTLVYIDSLEGVRKVSSLLREKEWPVLSFHSRSSLPTRLALLETYRSEEVAILVCTDMFARGLDVRADHVINFSFPRDAATFVHRTKGTPTLVTNLVEPRDTNLASELRSSYESGRPVNQLLSRKRSFGNRYRRALQAKGAPDQGQASHFRSRRTSLRGSRVRRASDSDDDESPDSRRPRANLGRSTGKYKNATTTEEKSMESQQKYMASELPIDDLDGIFERSSMDTQSTADVGDTTGSQADEKTPVSAVQRQRADGVKYRRLSMKRRGMEFYDNFRAFS